MYIKSSVVPTANFKAYTPKVYRTNEKFDSDMEYLEELERYRLIRESKLNMYYNEQNFSYTHFQGANLNQFRRPYQQPVDTYTNRDRSSLRYPNLYGHAQRNVTKHYNGIEKHEKSRAPDEKQTSNKKIGWNTDKSYVVKPPLSTSVNLNNTAGKSCTTGETIQESTTNNKEKHVRCSLTMDSTVPVPTSENLKNTAKKFINDTKQIDIENNLKKICNDTSGPPEKCSMESYVDLSPINVNLIDLLSEGYIDQPKPHKDTSTLKKSSTTICPSKIKENFSNSSGLIKDVTYKPKSSVKEIQSKLRPNVARYSKTPKKHDTNSSSGKKRSSEDQIDDVSNKKMLSYNEKRSQHSAQSSSRSDKHSKESKNKNVKDANKKENHLRKDMKSKEDTKRNFNSEKQSKESKSDLNKTKKQTSRSSSSTEVTKKPIRHYKPGVDYSEITELKENSALTFIRNKASSHHCSTDLPTIETPRLPDKKNVQEQDIRKVNIGGESELNAVLTETDKDLPETVSHCSCQKAVRTKTEIHRSADIRPGSEVFVDLTSDSDQNDTVLDSTTDRIILNRDIKCEYNSSSENDYSDNGSSNHSSTPPSNITSQNLVETNFINTNGTHTSEIPSNTISSVNSVSSNSSRNGVTSSELVSEDTNPLSVQPNRNGCLVSDSSSLSCCNVNSTNHILNESQNLVQPHIRTRTSLPLTKLTSTASTTWISSRPQPENEVNRLEQNPPIQQLETGTIMGAIPNVLSISVYAEQESVDEAERWQRTLSDFVILYFQNDSSLDRHIEDLKKLNLLPNVHKTQLELITKNFSYTNYSYSRQLVEHLDKLKILPSYNPQRVAETIFSYIKNRQITFTSMHLILHTLMKSISQFYKQHEGLYPFYSYVDQIYGELNYRANGFTNKQINELRRQIVIYQRLRSLYQMETNIEHCNCSVCIQVRSRHSQTKQLPTLSVTSSESFQRHLYNQQQFFTHNPATNEYLYFTETPNATHTSSPGIFSNQNVMLPSYATTENSSNLNGAYSSLVTNNAANSNEENAATRGLSWIDDLEPSMLQKEFDDHRIKTENIEAIYSTDSGRESSSPLQHGYNSHIFTGRLCSCGKPAIYVCPCGIVMYCSSSCQTEDWIYHKSVCVEVVRRLST